jgi:hypothetical protein
MPNGGGEGTERDRETVFKILYTKSSFAWFMAQEDFI